jgi:sugar phosphate permease
MPAYLIFRGQPAAMAVPAFGGITVVAGLLSTLLGGFVADRLRKRISGSYFLVSGLGMILAFPLFIATIYAPFPLAWVCLFLAVFFVFLNTGPSNAALANVAPPKVRASAFALNILIIHLLGDAISPPLLGYVAGRSSLNVAFFIVSVATLISGIIWLFGMKFLDRDTAAVEQAPA